VPLARISIAVHRLTRLFLGTPAAQLTVVQIRDITGLDPDETRIVVEALKDAGFLSEREDGDFVTRAAAG
jgi:hypothetical protein